MEWIYWIAIGIVFYAYFGYGILISILTKIPGFHYLIKLPEGYGIVRVNPKIGKFKTFEDRSVPEESYEPMVTLLVAAYNEESVIDAKMKNTYQLDYPREKLEIMFVTDGSTDRTNEKLAKYPDVRVLYQPERRGKIAAVNRAVPLAKGEIIVFSDANSMFNSQAIRKLIRHFRHPKVGCVAGEKRVKAEEGSTAGEGEGLYWKYESYLKRKDSELFTVVGAAGEIFAIRKELFEPVPEDSIIEDFVMSLLIASKGYKVVYEPEAISYEDPSISIREEFKRKVRIAAGGFQAMVRLRKLTNIRKFGLLSFQYISHRMLRWAVVPPLLVIIYLLNIILALRMDGIYTWLAILQSLFYLFALFGWLLELKHKKIKIFTIPLFFTMMNIAVFSGFYRFVSGKQKVTWEKVTRLT